MSPHAATVMFGACILAFACRKQAHEVPVSIRNEKGLTTDAGADAAGPHLDASAPDAAIGPPNTSLAASGEPTNKLKSDGARSVGIDARPAMGVVRVTNIGMHIGGSLEINTEENKAPIEQSAKRSFGAFQECATSSNIDLPTEYGIDLLIEAKGGVPTKIDNARTQSKNETFRRCMLEAFQKTDFMPPRTGRTRVSYSLRFSR